ncbi:Fe-S cluster assembly protein SufD [Blattabacterium cuenoti]|uniref:Fe-S cluster assembly protein SufD n=1 Tax=Blattabacterium cuenoti TaxID=1653831 RepID=UPI00163BD7BE|nr:Fe-S cluster assembly protein SufD [Blattabacterium cuenoti]
MQLKEKIILLISNDKYYSRIENNTYVSYLQRKHIDFFKKKGFPSSVTHEEWKNTDINSIINQDYHIIFFEYEKKENIEYNKIEELTFFKKKKESFLLIFIDGVYYSSFSQTKIENKNVVLSNIISQKENIIKSYYGKLSYEYDAFYTLNTFLSKDGAYIYIPNHFILDKPIEILHISTGDQYPVMLNPRNLIIVGEHSSVQIIEHHKSLKNHLSFINSVSEIYVSNHSKIDYYKIQNNFNKISIIDNTFFKQKKNSKSSVYTFSFQGNFIRNNLKLYSYGEKTYSYLYGISLLSEKQFVDHHTFMNHSYSNAFSFQLYKNILLDKSKSIFNGKITIDKWINNINAYQRNNNILLSKEAFIYAKPQLEIYSKNVKCSHGCTIGNIQEYELFYLQSRGISKKYGTILLLLSFLEEILKPIHIFELRKFIYKEINLKLDKYLL